MASVALFNNKVWRHLMSCYGQGNKSQQNMDGLLVHFYTLMIIDEEDYKRQDTCRQGWINVNFPLVISKYAYWRDLLSKLLTKFTRGCQQAIFAWCRLFQPFSKIH